MAISEIGQMPVDKDEIATAFFEWPRNDKVNPLWFDKLNTSGKMNLLTLSLSKGELLP